MKLASAWAGALAVCNRGSWALLACWLHLDLDDLPERWGATKARLATGSAGLLEPGGLVNFWVVEGAVAGRTRILPP